MMLSRRTLLAAGAAMLAGTADRRFACLDWGLAETVLALGAVPVGVPDPADYRRWVVEPALPDDVADLGLRSQPNRERLAALRPDTILATEPPPAALEAVAPVIVLPIYTAEHDPWARSAAAARAIAAQLGRPETGERLIAETETLYAASRLALAGVVTWPLLLGSFADPRYLTVYGTGSLLGAALDRLGLHNAWTGRVGRWGSATIGADELAGLADATLVLIAPTPPDLRETMATSPLWRSMPFGAPGRTLELPPVLMFGTLPAAGRFARLLVPALTGRQGPVARG